MVSIGLGSTERSYRVTGESMCSGARPLWLLALRLTNPMTPITSTKPLYASVSSPIIGGINRKACSEGWVNSEWDLARSDPIGVWTSISNGMVAWTPIPYCLSSPFTASPPTPHDWSHPPSRFPSTPCFPHLTHSWHTFPNGKADGFLLPPQLIVFLSDLPDPLVRIRSSVSMHFQTR